VISISAPQAASFAVANYGIVSIGTLAAVSSNKLFLAPASLMVYE